MKVMYVNILSSFKGETILGLIYYCQLCSAVKIAQHKYDTFIYQEGCNECKTKNELKI